MKNLYKLGLVGLVFCSSLNVFAEDSGAGAGATLYKQCIMCHGERGEGNPAQKAPRISSQYDWYVLKQLQDMKAGSIRKNPIMNPYLAKLSEQDMKDLASYISKL